MTRIIAWLVLAVQGGVAAHALYLNPLQVQQQAQGVFRAGVDLFHLDVSVLDKNRQPVRGLTQADFTVLEDGKPQRVVALSAVDVPDPVLPPVGWMRDVVKDVATNQLGDGRLFVIVMDDATIPRDLWAEDKAKQIGRDVVNRLGPADLAAVVFVRDNREPQDFTGDHRKLLDAVERYTPGLAGRVLPGGLDTELYYKQSSIDVVAEAARFLIDVPERRKAIVYITYGLAIDADALGPQLLSQNIHSPSNSMARREGNIRLQERMVQIFRNAERANVNVYPFDIGGLRADGGGKIVDFLLTVASTTGGHATVNTNDFAPGIVEMFRENSSYYVVGYESTARKGAGSYRRVEVKVDRRDVEVRARTRYYASKPPQQPKPGSAPASPLTAALAGLLPNPEMPLTASVFPVAIPGRLDQAAVAIVPGMQRAASAAVVDASSRIETTDLLLSAFDLEGRPRGSKKQTTTVTVRPDGNGLMRYELLARMDLKPGRYQIRLAAHDTATAKNGSVYADVNIPNFSKDPLSMSGLILSATPGVASAPRDTLSSLVPFVPTAEREFVIADRVVAFTRVYQGGDNKRPPVPVEVHIRLLDSQNATIIDVSQTLDVERFGSERAADVRFDVPIGRLIPRDYLLTIEARSSGGVIVRRDVRFKVM